MKCSLTVYILCLPCYRGIHYEAETAMRERGLAKTPDILLPVPVAVKDSTGDWHIVKWIDSKAMFGYPDSFKEQVKGTTTATIP
jgi:Protein of unknown function TPD sequence-motif